MDPTGEIDRRFDDKSTKDVLLQDASKAGGLKFASTITTGAEPIL